MFDDHNQLKMPQIEKKEDERIASFARNILRLRKEGVGLVFACGAIHSQNLISELKRQGLDDQVVYYFTHSSKSYEEGYDDIKKHLNFEVLKDRIIRLDENNEIKTFSNRVVKEIKQKNRNYCVEVIEKNSHAEILSKLFNVQFTVKMRPGYYVDALLAIEENTSVNEIKQSLKKFEVAFEEIQINGKPSGYT